MKFGSVERIEYDIDKNCNWELLSVKIIGTLTVQLQVRILLRKTNILNTHTSVLTSFYFCTTYKCCHILVVLLASYNDKIVSF